MDVAGLSTHRLKAEDCLHRSRPRLLLWLLSKLALLSRPRSSRVETKQLGLMEIKNPNVLHSGPHCTLIAASVSPSIPTAKRISTFRPSVLRCLVPISNFKDPKNLEVECWDIDAEIALFAPPWPSTFHRHLPLTFAGARSSPTGPKITETVIQVA